MPLNTTNLLMSMAVLHNSKVPQDKKLAASVGAALMPGMLGLALPLVVARNYNSAQPGTGTATGTGTGTGTGAGGGTADPQLRTRVPDVRGLTEERALKAIKAADLTPQVSYAYLKPLDTGAVPPKGEVAAQEPKASGDWVPAGSTVRIEVSLGAPPIGNEEDEHAHHHAFEQEINNKMEVLDDKMDVVLDKLSKFDSGTSVPH